MHLSCAEDFAEYLHHGPHSAVKKQGQGLSYRKQIARKLRTQYVDDI